MVTGTASGGDRSGTQSPNRRMVWVVYGEIVARSSVSIGCPSEASVFAAVLMSQVGVDHAVGEQLVELDDLLLVVWIVATDHLATERSHAKKPGNASALLVIAVICSAAARRRGTVTA